MRQQGNSQLAFRAALEGLRNYTLRYEDQYTLAARTAVSLSAKERRSFDNATYIYFRNEDVRDYNEQRLRETNNLVVRLKAKHNNKTISSRASVDKYGQLEDKIEVAIGYKIMLLTNMQTKSGLVNSTTSFLYNIEQPIGTTHPRDTLLYTIILRIRRADYNSPFLYEFGYKVTVPIFRSKRPFYRGGQEHYREQFPIRVAFAITVYKAQGIILDKAVVDITVREFASSLRYVAMSRVKTLQSIMFKKPFDFSLFTTLLGTTSIAREADIERRRN